MHPSALLTLGVLLTALLSGCASNEQPGNDEDGTTTAGAATGHKFQSGFEQGIEADWETELGTWSAEDGSGNHTGLIRGVGQADPGLSSLLFNGAGSFTDFELETDFQMLSGEHPQGAGVVINWHDDDDYQIIRASISEMGWHLFTVNAGNRDKQGDATLEGHGSPDFGAWVHLRVRSQGGHVEAYEGETMVLDYQLATDDSQAGRVGIFVRGDTVALFDNFSIEPL